MNKPVKILALAVVVVIAVAAVLWLNTGNPGSKHCESDSDCRLQEYGCYTGCWNQNSMPTEPLLVTCDCMAPPDSSCRCIEGICARFRDGERIGDSC